MAGEDTRFNGVEEVGALSLLFDVSVNQERVGFRVNILHHDLEAVEAPGFWDLDFIAESLEEILVDDTVRGGKERKDVRNEESFIVIETVFPIVGILGEVNFLGSPERCLGLLVHLPNLGD